MDWNPDVSQSKLASSRRASLLLLVLQFFAALITRGFLKTFGVALLYLCGHVQCLASPLDVESHREKRGRNCSHFSSLRSVLGLTWRDRVSNASILEATGSRDLITINTHQKHSMAWACMLDGRRPLTPKQTLHQGSATCSTHATLDTPNNFQWHAEASSFTCQFCYDSQEVLLTLTQSCKSGRAGFGLKLVKMFRACLQIFFKTSTVTIFFSRLICCAHHGDFCEWSDYDFSSANSLCKDSSVLRSFVQSSDYLTLFLRRQQWCGS